jgi:hypothetical protein
MAAMTVPMKVGDLELLVEVSPLAGSESTSRLSDSVDGVHDAFVRAQSAIVEVATSTVAMFEAAAERTARPDALEVEFGLKFSAKGNVIIAGASGEATLKVTLTYDRSAKTLSS